MHQHQTRFGEQLREFRLRVGLSQAALAEQANLSTAAVAALERGARNAPYPRTLDALARALELSPHEKADLMTAGARAAPPRTAEPPSVAQPVSGLIHVPTWPTSLVGRDADVDSVRSLLSPTGSAARLLTLLGPGGVGKTRLACAAAAGLAEGFPDGIVFVDLAPLRDARLVPVTIARALAVRDSAERSAREVLLEYLAARPVLLVLDNFEHLLEAAPVIAELVSRCPRLAALVTSRTALRVQGERRYAVTPLATPGTTTASVDQTPADWPAVQLFIERAQAAAPYCAITEHASTVASICRRLDGMPLAIELAAARVPLLSPDALLRRLERPFPLLTAGARDLPSRQQTLHDTLTWSYDLLDPAEQALFRRLAVFAGGWTLEAAEAVCGRPDLPAEAVLDRLHLLVDSSLVQVLDGGRDERRFGLLETVHEYAEGQLTRAVEATSVRRAHADYYLRLGEAAEPELTGSGRSTWLRRLTAEWGNLRLALDWYLAEDPETGVRLAAALARFWTATATSEGREWLIRLVARAESRSPSAAKALSAAAMLAWMQGANSAAQLLAQDSVQRWRALGDQRGLAEALSQYALAAHNAGDPATARATAEESLQLARALGNRAVSAQALETLGHVARLAGDASGSATQHAAALALFREVGDTSWTMSSLCSLGSVAQYQGDAARASECYAEVLRALTLVRIDFLLMRCLHGVAAVAALAGDWHRAARLFGAAEALAQALAMPLGNSDRALLEGRVREVRAALGDPTFTSAWADGRHLGVDEAMGEAIAVVTPTPARATLAAGAPRGARVHSQPRDR
jgi:predicted ATPase/transcriptional regulator with XRE-family HTH domain